MTPHFLFIDEYIFTKTVQLLDKHSKMPSPLLELFPNYTEFTITTDGQNFDIKNGA